MTELRTPLDVFSLLPRTNCRQCGAATCMAFAAAVVHNEKALADCPHLGAGTVEQFSGSIIRQVNIERIQELALKELQEQVGRVDLTRRAAALGGMVRGEGIVISCLGREFEIDRTGRIQSLCHTHAWFSVPLLSYVLRSRGAAPSGRWVPFRDLPGAAKWSALFEQRCERPLHRVADSRPDLFDDLVGLFSGTRRPAAFHADTAVSILPLPLVPVLLCYWRADDEIPSKLHLFLDDTAGVNLPLDDLFTLMTGLARMFEKILLKHADGVIDLP